MGYERILASSRVLIANRKATELQDLEDYLAKNLFSWMRADYRTEANGKVTAFSDKVTLVGNVASNARTIDSSHAFVQPGTANQVTAITSSSNWGNKETATFAAASVNRYSSTLTATPWRFLFDGTGMSVMTAYRPTSNGTFIWSNQNGTTSGSSVSQQTAQTNITIRGNGLQTISSTAGSTPLNTATYTESCMSTAASPQWQLLVKTAVVASGTLTNPAQTGVDALVLGIGAQGVSFPFNGDISDIMFATRIDPVLRAAQQRYMFLRYGIA